jgi:hypothetical protein
MPHLGLPRSVCAGERPWGCLGLSRTRGCLAPSGLRGSPEGGWAVFLISNGWARAPPLRGAHEPKMVNTKRHLCAPARGGAHAGGGLGVLRGTRTPTVRRRMARDRGPLLLSLVMPQFRLHSPAWLTPWPGAAGLTRRRRQPFPRLDRIWDTPRLGKSGIRSPAIPLNDPRGGAPSNDPGPHQNLEPLSRVRTPSRRAQTLFGAHQL